jgi:hypothetical protein
MRSFSRFTDDPEHVQDFRIILQWIKSMGDEKGTLERYFRPERRARAIPIVTSSLRLYCIRLSDELVILGNGGIKESRVVQDSPTLYPSFVAMNKVAQAVTTSIYKGRTLINRRELTGKLDFEVEI